MAVSADEPRRSAGRCAGREVLRVLEAVDPDDPRAGRVVVPLHPRLRALARRPHQAGRRRRVRGLHRPGPGHDGDGRRPRTPTTRRRSSARASTATSTTSSPRRCGRGRSTSACRSAGSCAPLLIGISLHGARDPGDVGARSGEPAELALAVGAGARAVLAPRRRSSGSTRRRGTTRRFVNNIVILPLTFLGGVFYSVDVLPVAVARALPREPDLLPRAGRPLRVPRDERRGVGLALLVLGAMAAITVGWSSWLFATGRRLKP